MSFSLSSERKAPPEFQGCLYVRKVGEELVIAGETELSKVYGLSVGEPIGEVPKTTPIREESHVG